MMSSHTLINDVAQASVAILLNSLWQSVVLTALAGLVLRGMRWANAATRYGFLCITLLALIALPVINGFSVQRSKTQPQLRGSLASEKDRQSPVPESVVAVAPAQHENVAAENDQSTINSTVSTAAHPHWWSREIKLPSGNWLLVLFGVWLLVAAVRVGRVGLSLLRLYQLKRSSSSLAPECELRLRQLVADCRIKRNVRLGGLTNIGMPMVVGLLRPIILFPQKLVAELTEDEFELILLHELGHVRRWDDWTNLIQKLAEAVFFFDPAILWVGRRLNLEREIACDDHVVSRTQESRAYAICLTRLAELSLMPRRASLAPGALFSKKQIVSRVELLLKKRNAYPHVSRLGLLASTGILVATIQCLLLSPVIAVSKDASENTEPHSRQTTAIAEEFHSKTSSDQNLTHSGTVQASSSDSRSRVVYRPENPETNQGNSLLESLAKLPSSWDKAEALIDVLGENPVLDSVPDDFFAAVKTIPSPADQTRVLSTFLNKRLSKGLLVQTLKAIASVETESDKRELLIRAARVCPNDDAVLSVYLQVVAAVRSPSDQDSALSALLERPNLSRDILLKTKNLALTKIASTQSQQHVVEKVDLRLAEQEQGKA